MKAKRRWVIKAGSQMVCGGGYPLIKKWMHQVSILAKRHGVQTIWVTSGAIASAAEATRFRAKKKSLPEKQALSALGQPIVMDQYLKALKFYKKSGAQVLLTAGDMKDHERRKNLQNTISTLLSWDVLPIVNENDAVATEEIKFGDNDSLSAKIAVMMKAERLVLLTDVEGFFDADPKKNKKAKLIAYKNQLKASDILGISRGAGSARGTGGMYSKLFAARYVAREGITAHLVKGDKSKVLLRLAEGSAVGTQIGGRDPWR